jgi:predicted nucleic acid-binding protein
MRICFDACFAIALYDEREPLNKAARACFNLYVETRPSNSILFPWPVMYETISTRMARVPRQMDLINAHFKALLSRNQLHFIDDATFRDRAMDACFRAVPNRRSLSLVDCIVREMLSAKELQATALATFNRRDFYDVCRKHNKAIIPN